MDMVANKVIQKYQSSSCEQLWEAKGQPVGAEEQRVIGFLKSDPQMRAAILQQGRRARSSTRCSNAE